MQGRPEACRAHTCSPSRPYQGNPTFDPEFIRSKSTAAAGLCSWCINIVRFYEVYCDVAPKRQALEEANAELAEAQEKLSRIKNKIAVSAGPHGTCSPGGGAAGRRGEHQSQALTLPITTPQRRGGRGGRQVLSTANNPRSRRDQMPALLAPRAQPAREAPLGAHSRGCWDAQHGPT